MKVYISGPMTGLPESNYPAFEAAAKMLRSKNYQVYNPSERPWDNPRAAFKDYCDFICGADAVYMLPGWEKSIGARAEHALAVAVGCQIIYEGQISMTGLA